MFSKWGFLFLLILAIFATGCRGLGSVIDDIPIPLVGSVIDNIVLVVKPIGWPEFWIAKSRLPINRRLTGQAP